MYPLAITPLMTQNRITKAANAKGRIVVQRLMRERTAIVTAETRIAPANTSVLSFNVIATAARQTMATNVDCVSNSGMRYRARNSSRSAIRTISTAKTAPSGDGLEINGGFERWHITQKNKVNGISS